MKHLILTILFTLSLFAQEIGVPYVQLPKDAKELTIGLSRDGKTFYTYENNTLIHWNMNPVQIIDSVKITDPMFPSPLNFDVTPDGKKVIFSNPKHGIGLFDLEKKQFINKKATLYDSDLLLGSNIMQADSELGIITVLNINNFQTIKTIFVPLANHGRYEDRIYGLFRSIEGKHFIVFTADLIQIYDIATLTITKVFAKKGTSIISSLDKQTIQGGIRWRYANSALDTYQNPIDCFDMNTLTYFTKKDLNCRKMYPISTKYSKNLLNIYEYEDWYYPYIDRIYDDASTNVLARLVDHKLYQLSETDWLIITPDGYFDGSHEARKYLSMKNPVGESTPIDDVTFNKFHKKINLKD
jgi:hypothetical protein